MEVGFCPTGLFFDHTAEGFWRKSITRMVVRNSHPAAICMPVSLVTPFLGTEKESIANQSTEEFTSRQGTEARPVHQLMP